MAKKKATAKKKTAKKKTAKKKTSKKQFFLNIEKNPGRESGVFFCLFSGVFNYFLNFTCFKTSKITCPDESILECV